MKVALLTTDNREVSKDYAASAPSFGFAPEALLQGFALLPNVEVHVVSCTRKEVISPDKLAPNIFFHSVLVPRMGWMRTLFTGCILALRKKLTHISPDIVHGQGTESYSAISAAYSGFPNVCTLHGIMRRIAEVEHPRPFSYNWLAALLEGFTIPHSQGIICISGHAEEAIRGLARRSWLIPNAVDATFFEVNAAAKPGVPPIFLCVGRICALKNQIGLIMALESLRRTREFDLVFLGSAEAGSPYAERFQELVKQRPWCAYYGFAGRDAIKTHMGKATALILPSLEENCPMVVLEAMAARLPVVASKVGGVPDLVEHNQTGFLFDPHDAGSVCEPIEAILKSPVVSVQIAQRSKQHALETYHPKIIARRHLEVYCEVLGLL